jgi:pSer/pThr/pTyr-binding forkhead associated (FHA) protein/Zn-dependent protease
MSRICPTCRRQIDRSAPFCPLCGAARSGTESTFDLVLDGHTRIPVVSELTIGRGPGNAVRLTDPTVSRQHALIRPATHGVGPVLQDAGSSYGTWVDGRRLDGPLVLRDGARIEFGDHEATVERRRDEAEAGRTVVVPPGASVAMQVPAGASQMSSQLSSAGPNPRLRSGYALKRLAATEGARRWVLKDITGQRFVRLTDRDAALVQLLDGRHSTGELVREAEDSLGTAGPARLAQLLSMLAARGLLGGTPTVPATDGGSSPLTRLFRPRIWSWSGAANFFDRVYQRGGWVLFTRPVIAMVATIVVVGLGTFAYLVTARYGTPFVVAKKIGLGGLVFVVARVLIAALHETAHALTMASFGRRIGDAGVKVILIFPFTFVDTSDAWFEPRRRRIAVTAAGPACDLTLGGTFALACLMTPTGTVRDVFFQLSFGAYYGALFNLNPLLERDGYQILVDVTRAPGLRRKALEQLRRRVAGRTDDSDSLLLRRYAVFSLTWMVVVAAFAVAMSLRYRTSLESLLPGPTPWIVLAAIWMGLLLPPLVIVGPPLIERARGGGP